MKIFIQWDSLRIAKNSDLDSKKLKFLNQVCNRYNVELLELSECYALSSGDQRILYKFLFEVCQQYDVDLI